MSTEDFVAMVVAEAIDLHSQVKRLLVRDTTTLSLRRTMVKAAIIIGLPVEG